MKYFCPIYKPASNILESVVWKISFSFEASSLVWNICKHLSSSSEVKYFQPPLSHLPFPLACWASVYMGIIKNYTFWGLFPVWVQQSDFR